MNIKCHGNRSRRVPFNGRRSVKKPFRSKAAKTQPRTSYQKTCDWDSISQFLELFNLQLRKVCKQIRTAASVFFIFIISYLPVFSSSAFFLICQCFLHLHSFSSASVFFIFILSLLPVLLFIFILSHLPVFSSVADDEWLGQESSGSLALPLRRGVDCQAECSQTIGKSGSKLLPLSCLLGK